MSLETILADIIVRLRQGRFQNEQAVSQGIVLPILRELGWDIFDTTLVWPEYQTGEAESDETPLSFAATRAGFASAYRQALEPSASETPRRRRARRANAVRQPARKEYRSRNRRTQACAAIPEAWRELVQASLGER